MQVQILGSVRLRTGDERASPPSASQRRLLAVLATHVGESMRIAYLSDLLAVSPPALRTTVSRLRHLLGPSIHTDPCSYRLEADVDAEAFVVALAAAGAGPTDEETIRHLDAALAMWQGPALDEFQAEVWAQPCVARLDELRSVAVERRARALLDLGRHGEAIAALDIEVEEHPLHDRPHRLLMEALAAEGRQAEALRVYHRHRQHLAEHVGTQPSIEIQRLEATIAGAHETVSPDAATAPDRLIRR
jgi:DNA-binding SARP family transcriptional activator